MLIRDDAIWVIKVTRSNFATQKRRHSSMLHDAEAASTLLYTEYLFGFIHADNVIIETDPSC